MDISEKRFFYFIKIYMGGNSPPTSACLVCPGSIQNCRQQATSLRTKTSVADSKAERIWVLDDLLSFWTKLPWNCHPTSLGSFSCKIINVLIIKAIFKFWIFCYLLPKSILVASSYTIVLNYLCSATVQIDNTKMTFCENSVVWKCLSVAPT